MKIEHQLVSFFNEQYVGMLDRYAAEGWEVVSCWPVGTGYRCLLRRPDALERFLDKPFPLKGTAASALEALGESEAQ